MTIASKGDEFARSGGYGGEYLTARLADELVSLCRGILIDGAVDRNEARGLWDWCAANPGVSRSWPGRVVIDRLSRLLADGAIGDAELADLKSVFEEISGFRNGFQEPLAACFTDPTPEITFGGKLFAVTGGFLFGTRQAVMQAIVDRRGRARDEVVATIDYLLVGSRASPAWKETNYGSKIERVMEMNRKQSRRPVHGRPQIGVIAERDWVKCLGVIPSTPPAIHDSAETP
ncbi:MAG TPA: hypothetical protein VGM20_04245 [Gemmatimonadales bacterium]|jgi:hypothetical protein